MKKLIIFLFILPLLATAKVPVEDDIIDATLSPSSPYYHPNLMMRYIMGDTMLTENEYHYLYYGYAYQDNYKPLVLNPDLDKTLMLAASIDTEEPLVEDINTLISVTNGALTRDPFSPQLLNLMAFAHGALGDTIQEKAYYRKMEYVLKTIESSGDALTQKTPQHVLMFGHANDLLTSKSIAHGKGKIISRLVQYIPLTKSIRVDGKKIKGYYFDFGRVYWNKPEGYTYKRDRTWQFNNLKPREYK